ncbi:hypothetical protein [Vallitalea okinawensis]|uniref:hypothetical protein n=1 Tax=Vallitalea okinawensis TaxID=2078660 RepID=UPI000CFBBE08|nr:hypothetical protein [Vallitalea okinawensis]
MNHSYKRGLAYLFSLIPGAGQMYIGLMNRGLQIMLFFWGTIAVISFVNVLEALGLLLVVLYFYSFFDAINAIRKHKEGIPVEDHPIINYNSLDATKRINKKIIGYVFIFLGAFKFLDEVMYLMKDYFIDSFYHNFDDITVSILLILIGVVILIRFNKNSKNVKQLPQPEE